MPLRLYALLSALLWVPSFASRVVSTSPQITEHLFQLGLGHYVVATSDYSRYPDGASKLPSIGPLFNPSIEVILKLKPDWVIVDGKATRPDFVRALSRHSIPYFEFTLSSIEELFQQSHLMLDTVFGIRENGVITEWEQYLACLKKHPVSKKHSFIMALWLQPPILANRNAFLSNLLELAGGKNAVPETIHIPYPQISVEWLIQTPVDRIYLLSSSSEPFLPLPLKQLLDVRKIIPLNEESFGRASLTALAALEPFLATPTTKVCRAPKLP